MKNIKKSFVSAAKQQLRPLVSDGVLSYSSYGSIIARWSVFADFLAAQGDCTRVSNISREMVIEFSETLLEAEPSYSQNMVSSINTVMRALTKGSWIPVSPTFDCGIPRRCNVRTMKPSGMDSHQLSEPIRQLEIAKLWRGKIIAEAARAFGLRVREASLLNYGNALAQALSDGNIEIRLGTKGGRPRTIPITSRNMQITLLRAGADIQREHFSLIPKDLNWKKFRENEIAKTRAILKSNGIISIRDLRAAYACQRYQDITSVPAPVLGGNADKELDKKARIIIARELGHNRPSITNSYLGRSHANQT